MSECLVACVHLVDGQVCPLTADDRKAPCSFRGECNEVDGKAVCLCDLGFYGALCEFIAFSGSGLALSFDGADTCSFVWCFLF